MSKSKGRQLRIRLSGEISARSHVPDPVAHVSIVNTKWIDVYGRNVHRIVPEAKHYEIVRPDVVHLVRGIAGAQSLRAITHTKTRVVLAEPRVFKGRARGTGVRPSRRGDRHSILAEGAGVSKTGGVTAGSPKIHRLENGVR